MRILVTGGSGFIGTNFVASCLERGVEVCNVDIAPPLNPAHHDRWRQASIMDVPAVRGVLDEFRPSVVVHLAARTDIFEKRDLQAYAVNHDGTDRLIDALRTSTIIERVIFTSTMMVTRLGYAPRSDTDYCPHTLYGESKAEMERRIRAAAPSLDCDWCFVRPVSIWGPWMQSHYRAFFQLVANGRYFHVGSRPVMRGLGYVGNVVHQLWATILAAPPAMHGKVFYVGDDDAVSLRDWAESVRRSTGARRIPTIPLPLARLAATAGDAARAVGIPSPIYTYRLRNLTTDWILPMAPTTALAGRAPFSMPQGVDQTVAWLREHGHLG
jgi:nucleoside-diphosphate-sugar epimerase